MIIIDTDFLFSFYDSSQSTHLQSTTIMDMYGDSDWYLSNLVLQEIATVISYRLGFEDCQKILNLVVELELKNIFLNELDTDNIWKLFYKYQKKNISFVDCSNLYLAKKLGYKIASFDRFYPKEYLV
jgi:predicted nucleic acid-binding protein